jgi:two-component system, NtrC family, sensor histidine kinase KinB
MRSLRHRLWLGFGGLLAVLIGVSVLSLIVLTRYSRILERVFRENYDSVLYCEAMKESLDQLNNRAQQIIWQDAQSPPIDVAAYKNIFSRNLHGELGNITLPGEGDLAHQLSDLWNGYQSKYAEFDPTPAAARQGLYRADLLPLYQSMKQVAQQISDMNMSNMVSVDGQVKRTLADVQNALMLLVVTGTLVAFGVVSAASAAILRPLMALTRSARQVESGNLDLHVAVQSRDELGQLAEAFNAMSAKLREFRQQDHERLVRTKETTQLAIDSLPDGVFMIGPAGEIEISNRTARTHFGIEPGLTVAGLKLKWLPPLYDEVRRTGKSTDPQGYQSALQLFDGPDERFLLPRAVPMVGGGVTVILVDVTRLHGADAAKSSLVSTVSHELRTPLTSIRMALSLLTGEKFGAASPKQAQLLKAAREESERLYRIVENLLSMSRIESGLTQFALRPAPVQEIITPALDPMRAAYTEKNIQLTVDAPDTLPQALVDPPAVVLALSNLLSNALKYTPSGGQVRLAVAQDGQWIAFTVTDTGRGIPPEFTGRIFEKFFRVPQPEGPTGAGLGLSIAREIIDAHGGTIGLLASGNGGSTFRFTLRAAGK